jgi:hypothetical protein
MSNIIDFPSARAPRDIPADPVDARIMQIIDRRLEPAATPRQRAGRKRNPLRHSTRVGCLYFWAGGNTASAPGGGAPDQWH